MSNTIEILKNIYKPYKITKKGKCNIFETTSGTYVVKPKGSCNIFELQEYLSSRSFTHFPKLIDFSRSEVNIYEYINAINMPSEQKVLDIINLVGHLHIQTSYFKEVKDDDYREIYDNIKSNIIDTENYYNMLFESKLSNTYYSPSTYLFLRNFEIIKDSLEFAKNELEEWYNSVKNETKQRVCVIHNNLSLNHYLRNESEYLISWDESKIDSPVMDLIKFYKKEYESVDFSAALDHYFKNFKLSENEKKLFFICICIPDKYKIENAEIKTCANITSLLNYLYRTEKLIRPYYSVQEKKE